MNLLSGTTSNMWQPVVAVILSDQRLVHSEPARPGSSEKATVPRVCFVPGTMKEGCMSHRETCGGNSASPSLHEDAFRFQLF